MTSTGRASRLDIEAASFSETHAARRSSSTAAGGVPGRAADLLGAGHEDVDTVDRDLAPARGGPPLAGKALPLLDRFGRGSIGPDRVGIDGEDVAWGTVTAVRTTPVTALLLAQATPSLQTPSTEPSAEAAEPGGDDGGPGATTV